jgi:hypothetical protein
VVSDNHGDMVDERSARALWDFLKDYKPTIRIHAGDNWDFRNLRRGASDEEQMGSLENDWEAGQDFLKRYFDGSHKNWFLRGNHDERLYLLADNAKGLARDYAKDGIKRIAQLLHKHNAKMLPYDAALGVLDLGSLRILHGYHVGVGACRSHANVYGNCLFGHVHSIEAASVPNLIQAEARSIGCLCKRDMDYVAAKTAKLRWGNGWAYGVLFPDGTYQLWQTRKINDTFYAATDIQGY